MNGTGLSTGFFFFIGACLLITEINADSKFSYAEFTSSHLFCQNIQNFNCGLSDVHNIISVQIKGTIPRINKKFIEYRSFKNFDQEIFLNDLEQKNLNSIVDKCDNVNSAYENFESEFIKISHTFFSGAPLCSESMS
jgi:hypothetical protein